MRALALLSSIIFIGLIAVACSSEEPDTTSIEGSDSGNDVAPNDSGSNQQTPDDDAGKQPNDANATSDALTATKTTSVDATINNVSRTLSRAQFGTSSDDAGGQGTLYIEAHEGGSPECPTDTSPSPMRTMIVSNVPRGGAPGTTYTKDVDGIAVSFLDFTGDQLTDKPVTKATAATVTLIAIDGLKSVEIQVDATFPEGHAVGRIYATFCQSLSN